MQPNSLIQFILPSPPWPPILYSVLLQSHERERDSENVM
jgi:hypothetical protein